jgi:hypothetical protein
MEVIAFITTINEIFFLPLVSQSITTPETRMGKRLKH